MPLLYPVSLTLHAQVILGIGAGCKRGRNATFTPVAGDVAQWALGMAGGSAPSGTLRGTIVSTGPSTFPAGWQFTSVTASDWRGVTVPIAGVGSNGSNATDAGSLFLRTEEIQTWGTGVVTMTASFQPKMRVGPWRLSINVAPVMCSATSQADCGAGCVWGKGACRPAGCRFEGGWKRALALQKEGRGMSGGLGRKAVRKAGVYDYQTWMCVRDW